MRERERAKREKIRAKSLIRERAAERKSNRNSRALLIFIVKEERIIRDGILGERENIKISGAPTESQNCIYRQRLK